MNSEGILKLLKLNPNYFISITSHGTDIYNNNVVCWNGSYLTEAINDLIANHTLNFSNSTLVECPPDYYLMLKTNYVRTYITPNSEALEYFSYFLDNLIELNPNIFISITSTGINVYSNDTTVTDCWRGNCLIEGIKYLLDNCKLNFSYAILQGCSEYYPDTYADSFSDARSEYKNNELLPHINSLVTSVETILPHLLDAFQYSEEDLLSFGYNDFDEPVELYVEYDPDTHYLYGDKSLPASAIKGENLNLIACNINDFLEESLSQLTTETETMILKLILEHFKSHLKHLPNLATIIEYTLNSIVSYINGELYDAEYDYDASELSDFFEAWCHHNNVFFDKWGNIVHSDN